MTALTREPGTAPSTERIVEYHITYNVLADSRLEAIMQAGGKLRTGVRFVELIECEQGIPGWWDVCMAVEETLGGDPPEPRWLHEDPDFRDHGPDATYWTEGVAPK